MDRGRQAIRRGKKNACQGILSADILLLLLLWDVGTAPGQSGPNQFKRIFSRLREKTRN
jgi:hypothetical protein